jgi:hypothetical protein
VGLEEHPPLRRLLRIFTLNRSTLRSFAHILQIAETQKVLMMSNATAAHHCHPSLRSADTWFLVETQMFLAGHERVLANIRDADVVVENTAHVPYFTDRDPEVQS